MGRKQNDYDCFDYIVISLLVKGGVKSVVKCWSTRSARLTPHVGAVDRHRVLLLPISTDRNHSMYACDSSLLEPSLRTPLRAMLLLGQCWLS